jgi:hypothetical protein
MGLVGDFSLAENGVVVGSSVHVPKLPRRNVQPFSPTGMNMSNSDVRFDTHVLNRFSNGSNSNSFDIHYPNQHKVNIKGCGVLQIPSASVFLPMPSCPPLAVDYTNKSRSTSPCGSYNVSEGTMVFLGSRYSKDDLIAFGGISDAQTMVHTSEWIRMQANADDTQLERVMQLSAAKNTGSFTCTHEHSKYFLSSISNVDILARADKLGISLGGSPSNVMDKTSDNSRTVIMLTKNLEEKMVKPDESNTEVLNHASILSSDLGKDEDEESDDILGLTLSEIKLKSNLKKIAKNKKVQVRLRK